MKTSTNCNSKEVKKEDGKQWPQILAIVIASLGALTNGIFFAWSSPFIVKITQDKENYDITEDEASYFTYIPAILMVLSCFWFSKLTDIIGRKRTLLLIGIPHVTSWILIAVARNVYVFYAARAASGLADACCFAAIPMYIGEVATPRVRGTWGNCLTFALFLGQLLINVIGNSFSVKETAYICVSIPILFTALFVFMPESPYFYVMKGRFEDAKQSLRRLRGKENVEDDFKQLKSDVERQISESATWKDLYAIKSNRKALTAAFFLRISQQLGGMSVFSMYTQYIFEKSGSNISSATATISYSSLCLVLNVCAAFTVERFGRKTSYLGSSIACAIALFLESVYFFIDQTHPEVDLSHVNWLPVAGMFLYIIASSFGVSLVPTLMLGELFSASIKAKALTLVAIVLAFFQFVSNNIFYILTTEVGFYSAFLFFAVCSFVGSIWSAYLIPETKGKTLEEIQQALKKKRKKIVGRDGIEA